MGKCLWCDKDLPGPEATVCPSCVFRPISEAVEEQKKKTPEGVDPNFDLSVFGIKKNPQEGKRAGELNTKIMQASMVPKPKVNNMLNKVVKVKSRSHKDRSIIINGLTLTFDTEGLATILETQAEIIDDYCKVRPGRVWVVREEAPVVAPESQKTTSLPEVPAAVVVTEEKPAEEEKPEEAAPVKKAAPKKRTTKKRKTTKKTASKE